MNGSFVAAGTRAPRAASLADERRYRLAKAKAEQIRSGGAPEALELLDDLAVGRVTSMSFKKQYAEMGGETNDDRLSRE